MSQWCPTCGQTIRAASREEEDERMREHKKNCAILKPDASDPHGPSGRD